MSGYDRLAPFIREYVFDHGWTSLRDVQERAIDAILDGDDHVLIAAGTASGKTEAAFFPILTRLAQADADGFGALYIGPLKALINDQFERLDALMEEADIPVYAWHGDRPESEKKRAKRDPRGVLQITPEALEGLLMRQPGTAARLFGALRFVVIDEVHAFMGTDRGLQLQCQLCRIDRLTPGGARRVGLSATVSDYAAAQAWLSAGTDRETAVVESRESGRKLDLALQNYAVDPAPDEAKKPSLLDRILPWKPADDAPEAAEEIPVPGREDLYADLYALVRGRRCLVFTNSRAETESVVAALRAEAARRGEPDAFHAHHGSLSAAIRQDAEEAMKAAEGPATAVATRTLELGIDLGRLDRVVQLGAADSCAGFVQRLGRSGRRGQPAVMRFLTRARRRGDTPFDNLPWELLRTVAVVQLYLEERWVEPFEEKPLPYSLLVQQLLSALMAGERTSRALAKAVHTLPAFAKIPAEDYMALLRHMLDEDLVEVTETGTLLPGLKGERLAGDYRFLSVFQDSGGCRVIAGGREIGSIDALPRVGESFTMAGRVWQVTGVDEARGAVYVGQGGGGESVGGWQGGGARVHDRIVAKLRDILASDAEYPYLHPAAKRALAEARATARTYELDRLFTPLGYGRLLLHPWLGTRKLDTLAWLLRGRFSNRLAVQTVKPAGDRTALLVETLLPKKRFLEGLRACLEALEPEALVSAAPAAALDRNDAFVPDALRRRAYVYNHLDAPGLKAALLAHPDLAGDAREG